MKFQQWEPDLLTLVSRIDAGEIDLQPDFQRQEVWNVPKQRRLVDTILREWSMPPIHLIDAGNSILEVLDGQQRLAAIRDFVHGKFAIDGAIAPTNPYVGELNGKKYDQLPIEVRRRVDRYTVRAFRISDFLPEEPSELFYRLNQPTLLTAGEQRNSLYGLARTQLKELVQLFQSGNSKEEVGFSNARLAYDDVLARQLYFLTLKTIGIKATEAQISDMFRNESGFPSDVMDRSRAAIEQFTHARKNAGRLRLNKASLLSWLLFYSRGSHSDEKIVFLSQFVGLTDSEFLNPVLNDAHLVFNDRASGRVTDVSSVFLRDVCLWYCYYQIFDMSGPNKYTTDCLQDVSDIHEREGSRSSLEYLINSIVSIDRWSEFK